MAENEYHVSGEVQVGYCAGADSDERVGEETLRVRIMNVTRWRDVHAQSAKDCRQQADNFEALSNMYNEHLEVMRRIARERGISLEDADG